jgi:hypothetical protein
VGTSLHFSSRMHRVPTILFTKIQTPPTIIVCSLGIYLSVSCLTAGRSHYTNDTYHQGLALKLVTPDSSKTRCREITLSRPDYEQEVFDYKYRKPLPILYHSIHPETHCCWLVVILHSSLPRSRGRRRRRLLSGALSVYAPSYCRPNRGLHSRAAYLSE